MSKRAKKALISLIAVVSVSLGLTGCFEEQQTFNPKETYDTLNQDVTDDEGLLSVGLTQNLNVPGENFKLVTEYTCDSNIKREWRVTSDKFLYYNVYTQGLSDGVEVYIDNVHIDTSIKSNYASVDGVLQDFMDDHIHNSQMIGFPISDITNYYGVFAIEGCNQEFISGTFFAFNGFGGGDLEQERYTESDYRKLGVYANKFQIVYDLLIKGPNDLEFRNISVATDFLVPISTSEIQYSSGDYTRELVPQNQNQE